MLRRYPTFIRFCLVGGFGALVDAALLEMLVWIGFAPFFGRICSMLGALQITYLLHTGFTFQQPRNARGWIKFMISDSTGAIVNYLTFLLVLEVLPLALAALLHRQAALAAGTLVGLAFNYWANRRFVFHTGTHL